MHFFDLSTHNRIIPFFLVPLQSTGPWWQGLQVWVDQGVFPTGQVCRVWPDHEERPWEFGRAGEEGQEMAALLPVEEGAVVCPLCHQVWVIIIIKVFLKCKISTETILSTCTHTHMHAHMHEHTQEQSGYTKLNLHRLKSFLMWSVLVLVVLNVLIVPRKVTGRSGRGRCTRPQERW